MSPSVAWYLEPTIGWTLPYPWETSLRASQATQVSVSVRVHWACIWREDRVKEGFRRAGQRASQGYDMAPCQITSSSGPLPPQSLEIISRSSPSDLTIAWAPAPGQLEGYKVTWHQDGSQRSPGDLVDVGPDISSLTLKSLVPGSCYTISAWAWAGNLSSDSRKIHSCTREYLPCSPHPTRGCPALCMWPCILYSLFFSVV